MRPGFRDIMFTQMGWTYVQMDGQPENIMLLAKAVTGADIYTKLICVHAG